MATRPYAGKLADPEWRRERASKASQTRHSLDARIAAIVRDADKLTPDQIDRLRSLLPDPSAA